MSLFNSVLGSISPRFRDSFEDARAQEHELPVYRSPSPAPRIPPPIASTVLWSVPATNLAPPARLPDDLLALQRRARHLEQQLQGLLDAQADGLMSGLVGNGSMPDDLISNGSTTPTVSSVRSSSRSAESEEHAHAPRKKKVGLAAARKGISQRIQQLASVKAEELDYLDEDLSDLQVIVDKTSAWSKKRARLEKKIRDIEGDSSGSRAEILQREASKLEHEIQQKEDELSRLKARHRRVLDELSTSENAVEAKLSSYKASLAILDKDVASFLARPPDTNHVPLSSSPFLSLPPRRRTLEMAHDYWNEEHMRLVEKCEEVDIERAALNDGAVLWDNVVKKIVGFESNLQDLLQQSGPSTSAPSELIAKMETIIHYLEEKVDLVRSRNWNLLFAAISAELEAFKQGKDVLEEALGVGKKGKGKAGDPLGGTDSARDDGEAEEVSRSTIRIGREASGLVVEPPKQSLFHVDDEDPDPDPELMISHQDTDTD